MENENRMKVCPICKKGYEIAPAISRRDNKTLICPDCGTKEAMADGGLSADKQREILDMIHKYSGKFESGTEDERGEEEKDG